MTEEASPLPVRSLEWVVGRLGELTPRWTIDPNLADLEWLARQALHLNPAAPCDVAFLAQGGFNRVYIVNSPSTNAEYVLRVALPVDPQHKTLSEVATLAFVRQFSDLVPRVKTWSSQPSKLGFEWMLMERMPGKPLEDMWSKMPWEAATTLVESIVDLLATLFGQRLEGIGNLYLKEDISATSVPHQAAYDVGRIVSMFFFWGSRLTQPVQRGPYHSSHDWLSARPAVLANKAANALATSANEDDLDDAEKAQKVLEPRNAYFQRSSRLVTLLLPQNQAVAEVDGGVPGYWD
ncbi:MAG: hypothetical protein CYPHOPRED_004264 [Cyphobasidiales sp. Tagirdzhanova-0007]|nr:MAG: hypothetical protein CYPHOPRED_004264 [Cyphobasidiales sp. Tagirdzhanova-0007]